MADMKFLNCSECGNPHEVKDGDAIPHFGFFFAPREFGYYAGFSDSNPWSVTKEEHEVFLCHDCCVRLLETFPSIARAIGQGGHHPCDDDVPCCRYAWRGTENFGKRYKEKLVRTQHPFFDEVTQTLQWRDDEPEIGG